MTESKIDYIRFTPDKVVKSVVIGENSVFLLNIKATEIRTYRNGFGNIVGHECCIYHHNQDHPNCENNIIDVEYLREVYGEKVGLTIDFNAPSYPCKMRVFTLNNPNSSLRLPYLRPEPTVEITLRVRKGDVVEVNGEKQEVPNE